MTREPTTVRRGDLLRPPPSSVTPPPSQVAHDLAATHALRTPLTVIRGQAQLLRWWANRPGALNLSAILTAASRIEDAAGELASAIDDLHLSDALHPPSPVDLVLADGEYA
ncbi:MAG: hypothetical protein QOF01_1352 [Thermomicrobiales bacterium]|nr:hypothetical protein [Thermomicrobiales bacterium]